MKKLKLNRVVTKTECPWLESDLNEDAEIYEFTDHTYGCISWTGIAVTFSQDGEYPFFEIPRDAVEKA